MAGATYPVQILREDGTIFLEGEITFPDASDQPSVGPPFASGVGSDLTLLETFESDPLIVGGDDSDGVFVHSKDASQGLSVTNGAVTIGLGIGNTVAFFGQSGATQPTVADATAAAIISALASLGLIVDGT